MSWVLIALAVGATLAGFVGVTAALGGGNAIEHFLAPSFEAGAATHVEGLGPGAAGGAIQAREAVAAEGVVADLVPATHAPSQEPVADASHGEEAAHHMSWAGEMALMAFSVLVGLVGIFLAHRFYVRRPEISDQLAARFATAHRVLSNKYYVDELYDATVVRGTLGSAAGLWTVDRNVVDGAVNGTGWFTIFSSWISHLADKYIVDGLVNLTGVVIERSSFVFRRVQTGLVQNYALVMLLGVFVFVSVYLMLR